MNPGQPTSVSPQNINLQLSGTPSNSGFSGMRSKTNPNSTQNVLEIAEIREGVLL